MPCVEKWLFLFIKSNVLCSYVAEVIVYSVPFEELQSLTLRRRKLLHPITGIFYTFFFGGFLCTSLIINIYNYCYLIVIISLKKNQFKIVLSVDDVN